jgi:glycosyltransferase involved in cell wall biosynthesis
MAAIRVALCITDLEVGGAERCLAELAARLDRTRFDPVVYSLAPTPRPPRRQCVDVLEAAGVPILYLDATTVWSFGSALGRLRAQLAAQRPHLIQTFLFHANVLGRIAGRRTGVRRVVSGIRVAERASRWHLWLDRATDRLVDRHVCVSQAVARFAASEGRLPSPKLVVIPNGIDISRYPATPVPLAELGLEGARGVVTYVGRLERQKDVLWLLRAAPRFLADAAGIHLLLVGSGPQEEELRRFAGQLGVGKRVHFLGHRSDVPRILAASRLLVLPSQWEGMPNVVLEAMTSRLPVVASDVEGVRELLGEAAEPQVVPHGDTAQLGNKVLRVLNNPALAAELGQANRLRAENVFPIERMVKAYEALWTTLLDGG